MSQITINEILAVRYLSGLPAWSSDSRYIAFKYNDGGISDLWLIDLLNLKKGEQKPRRLTASTSGVSEFHWHPKEYKLVFIQDGNLCILDLENLDSPIRKLTQKGNLLGRLSMHPEGKYVAVSDGPTLFFYDLKTGVSTDLKPVGEVFGGRFSQTVHGDSFDFSPNGELFLYTWHDQNKKPYLALCGLKEGNIWRSSGHIDQISGGQWLDNDSFIYKLSGTFGAQYSYYLLRIPPKEQWENFSDLKIISKFKPEIELLFTEKDEKRNVNFTDYASIRPGNRDIIFGSDRDGFLHHYLFNLETKKRTQLTFGQWEDYAQAGDKITWSGDGKTYLYASNRLHRVERHIWQLNPETGENICLIDDSVTNLNPVFSPDGRFFVYNHSNKRQNADLWLYNIDTKEKCQLTDSMPLGLKDKISLSELITYKGAKDWDIDAFLYKPADFDPGKKYPAIVWVHGGPMRQMRGSWHPSSTYALFYAFNQVLASNGYVVLSPNFRGGIGYGRDFRHGLYGVKGIDDTIDIVNAGNYLKSLDYVDVDKVAVYGLSYGGYMTLHSMTQYPKVFACGINIAGLWDIAQWGFWMREKYGNYFGDSYFLGDMEENPKLWALGSPCTYKENLNKPLLSLQGTSDPNVDITQQDKLVMDMVKLGRKENFRAIYYPKESHTFRWRHTWEDAFPIMLDFFNQHLK